MVATVCYFTCLNKKVSLPLISFSLRSGVCQKVLPEAIPSEIPQIQDFIDFDKFHKATREVLAEKYIKSQWGQQNQSIGVTYVLFHHKVSQVPHWPPIFSSH